MKKTRIHKLTCALIGICLFLPQFITAQQWEQVGKKGDWKNTIDVVALGGNLYSIENDGTLFRTNKQGIYEQLGDKGAFDNVDILVAMDNEIWTLEDGSLYRSNSNTVSWKQIGKSGDWENTAAMVALNGKLYSIETDGTLYETSKDGTWQQIGNKGEFSDAEMLEAMDGYLWTVEKGTMNQIMDLLIDLRQQARNKKDFALSDQIRDRLSKIKIQLKDSKDGSTWTYEGRRTKDDCRL